MTDDVFFRRLMNSPGFFGDILRYTILLCSFFAFANTSQAQILDDSTQLVYGPSTTHFFYEQDALRGVDSAFRCIDTTIDGIHNYEYTFRDVFLRQDLGNLGSPSKSLYFSSPERIGVNPGFEALAPYGKTPSQIRYFNTKSPFSDLSYVQGGLGQQILNAEFSQNILPNWNAGIGYYKLTSDKMIGALKLRDRYADHLHVNFHTDYTTKDSRWKILFSYIFYSGKVNESGGIKPEPNDTKDNLFDYRDERVWLEGARSRERRSRFHLYQQFAPVRSKLLFYHTFEYLKQSNFYEDNAAESDFTFYPNIFLNNDITSQSFIYQLFENYVGTKGKFNHVDYRVYFRRKDFKLNPSDFDLGADRKWHSENFIGGVTSVFLSDSIRLQFSGEYLIAGKDYRGAASLDYKFLSALAERVTYSPTLVQTHIFTNHFKWDNTFSPVSVDRIRVNLHYDFRKAYVSAFGELNNINKLIYFNENAEPAQAVDPIRFILTGVRIGGRLGKFSLRAEGCYAKTVGPDLIRVPEFSAFSQFFYENRLFKKALLAQFGFDVRFLSAYRANAYMPATGQFYLQNTFLADAYPVADVFVNMLIRKIKVFVKLSHANMGFPRGGYFTTPFYTGIPRTFGFGVSWQFYD